MDVDDNNNYREIIKDKIKEFPNGCYIIYLAHGSANVYIGFSVLNGTYGSVIELGYNSIYANGCSTDQWGEWTKIL